MMKFFRLVPSNTNFDFVGKFKFFVLLSAVLAGASLWGMFSWGFNFGIDFTGGSVVQIKLTEPMPIDEVRALIESVGATGATVVAMDKTGEEYMITSRAEVEEGQDTLASKIVAKLGTDKVSVPQADIVGPKVGSELKASAARSLVYTIILIMVYIWFRFDFRFAPGATVALMHDMVVAAGFYVFTQREFDITAIAALLTIAGYSVNDTIVVYDRVRELFRIGGDDLPIGPTINKAINLTLSRTIVTSGTTLLTITPIALFSSGPIQAFAETMLIGVAVGTYSTYYVAAPLTIYIERWMARSNAKGTKGGKRAKSSRPL